MSGAASQEHKDMLRDGESLESVPEWSAHEVGWGLHFRGLFLETLKKQLLLSGTSIRDSGARGSALMG